MSSCQAPLTQTQKLLISAQQGLLFFLIASPLMYRLTNGIFKHIGLHFLNDAGNVTAEGLLVHALVFILLTFFLMQIHRGK